MKGIGVTREDVFLQYSPGAIEVLPDMPGIPHMGMLRLDQIRAWASGNKYFKLKHHLYAAMQEGYTHILSKGGMFSNHLAALAEACHTLGLHCTALVRSHQPDEMNPTIQQIRSWGADVIYLSPQEYLKYDDETARTQFPGSMFIPEGGLSEAGILGASEIIRECMPWQPTHIVVSGGTMATFAGLLSAAPANVQVIAVPAWKGCTQDYVIALLDRYQITPACRWTIWPEFHFGGFGRTTMELLEFMDQFQRETGISLDPVYTAKMMYALDHNCRQNAFIPESKILAIHTGGLQGRLGLDYMNAKKSKSAT